MCAHTQKEKQKSRLRIPDISLKKDKFPRQFSSHPPMPTGAAVTRVLARWPCHEIHANKRGRHYTRRRRRLSKRAVRCPPPVLFGTRMYRSLRTGVTEYHIP